MNKSEQKKQWVPMKEAFGQESVQTEYPGLRWGSFPHAAALEINISAFNRRSERLFYPDGYFLQSVSDTTAVTMSVLPNESGAANAEYIVPKEKKVKPKIQRAPDGYLLKIQADKLNQKANSDKTQYSQLLNREVRKGLGQIDTHDRTHFFKENWYMFMLEGIMILNTLAFLKDGIDLNFERTKVYPNYVNGIKNILIDVFWTQIMTGMKKRDAKKISESTIQIDEVPEEVQRVIKGELFAVYGPLFTLNLLTRMALDPFQSDQYVRLHSAKRT